MLNWDNQTKGAVAIAAIVILVILIVALYGYFSGAWNAGPVG